MAGRGGKGGTRAPSDAPAATPWKVRFSPRLLREDYDEVGHAAFEVARTAINRKLKVDPAGYGASLRSPLQGLYKLKASHVRIVYHIEEKKHEVWVLMIGGRRDIRDEDQGEIIERLGEERVADRERASVANAAAKKRRPRR